MVAAAIHPSARGAERKALRGGQTAPRSRGPAESEDLPGTSRGPSGAPRPPRPPAGRPRGRHAVPGRDRDMPPPSCRRSCCGCPGSALSPGGDEQEVMATGGASAATNPTAGGRVATGECARTFYYRIRVFQIQLTPATAARTSRSGATSSTQLSTQRARKVTGVGHRGDDARPHGHGMAGATSASCATRWSTSSSRTGEHLREFDTARST